MGPKLKAWRTSVLLTFVSNNSSVDMAAVVETRAKRLAVQLAAGSDSLEDCTKSYVKCIPFLRSLLRAETDTLRR